MFISELPGWVLIYFEKITENEYKCNVCDTKLKSDGKSLELLHHIREHHKDIYEIHNKSLDGSVNFEIEYLHLNVLSDDPKTGELTATDPIAEEVVVQTIDDNVKDKAKGATRPKRSWIWKYFEKLNKNVSRCQICERKLSIKNLSLGNLTRHFRGKHPSLYVEAIKKSTSSKKVDKPIRVKDVKSRNWIGKYFDMININTSRCSLCSVVLKSASPVNLLIHLKIQHRDEYKTICKENDTEKVPNKTSRKLKALRSDPPTGTGKISRKHHSWVWKHYRHLSSFVAKCKYCDINISFGGKSTGNLARHLNTIHGVTKDYWIWKVVARMEDSYSCRICDFTCTKLKDIDENVSIIRSHLDSEHGLLSWKQIVDDEDSTDSEDGEQAEENSKNIEKSGEIEENTEAISSSNRADDSE